MNFEKIKVLTFATKKYEESRNILVQHLSNLGITNQINCNDSDLPNEFKEEHSSLFDLKRGYGYWIWKPFLIKKILTSLKSDEILVYLDSSDLPSAHFFNFVKDYFNENNFLFFNQGYNHGMWTKSDCFFFMDCNDQEYYDHVQIEAGVIVMKNTFENIKLIDEWYSWMTNYQILNDSPNICNLPNSQNFQEHRHDQSILTNLIIKNKLPTHFLTKELVQCNVNQPI
jgi:hypothetical protein